MKMPIITVTEYWPAKYLGSEESHACADHEIKLYGWGKTKHKEWGIEILASCGQWDGNIGRIMTVLKIPPQHLHDWILNYGKRITIYFQKLDGYDSEYELWSNQEEMAETFKDEPFWKKMMDSNQKLVEKYGSPE